jgi:hypothetical protein
MSRVATAESRTLSHGFVPLSENWALRIEHSSLTGRLDGLEIMSQQPKPTVENVETLFGGVESAADPTVYALLDGQTALTERDGSTRQSVSFELIIGGQSYVFSGGELSADASSIGGGKISRYPLGSPDDPEVEDGTWSAQARPGDESGDEPGGGKGRKRAGLRRRQPR